ncbi:MAG: hypothetical protein C0P77_000890 [Thermoanaerobacterales bacterium]|nr:hypothetical protein [Thermoanaerobacterales bacterium]
MSRAVASPAGRRRLAAVILAPLVALALAACGDDGDDTIPTSGVRETTTTESTTTTTEATSTTAEEGAGTTQTDEQSGDATTTAPTDGAPGDDATPAG